MQTTRQTLRDQLPAWYRGDTHALVHFLFLGSVFLACVSTAALTDARWLLLVPAFVPLWSVVEYAIHRSVLHATFLPSLTRDHGLHHAYFADQMTTTHHRDLYRVFQRPQDVVGLEAVAFLAAGLAALVAGLPAAAAVAASGNLWFLAYEVTHAAAHSEWCSSRPLLGLWYRHHRIHHSTGMGNVANFSTVIPTTDAVLGTRHR